MVTQALDYRTHDCAARTLPPSRQGLGKSQPQRPRILQLASIRIMLRKLCNPWQDQSGTLGAPSAPTPNLDFPLNSVCIGMRSTARPAEIERMRGPNRTKTVRRRPEKEYVAIPTGIVGEILRAACKITGESPGDVVAGSYGSKARHYAFAALLELCPQASRPGIAKAVGAVGPVCSFKQDLNAWSPTTVFPLPVFILTTASRCPRTTCEAASPSAGTATTDRCG